MTKLSSTAMHLLNRAVLGGGLREGVGMAVVVASGVGVVLEWCWNGVGRRA